MQHLFMIITIYFFLFLAIFLLIRFFLQKGSEENAMRALGLETESRVVKSPIIKILRPAFRLFVPLARSIQTEKMRRTRLKQFVHADMAEEMIPEEFLAYQIFLALLSGLFLLFFKSDGSLLLFFVVMALAFLFPVKWLKDRVKIRSEKIVRELPHAVDILALSTEAGLGFVAGMHRMVLAREATPLMVEFEKMISEMNMGATRQDAFKNILNRCEAQELNQFIIIMVQASNLGVPISRVLRVQSEKMRQERFQKAERMGAYATQKLIFPMIFCIMPATMIVILGPLLIAFLLS